MTGTPEPTEPTPEPTEPVPEATPGDAARPAPEPRSLQQSLAAVVLGVEVIVVFLAALVIWGLARGAQDGPLPAWVALAAGGAIIVCLIATIGLLRYRWAYTLGWVLQVLILASGFLNPAMFVVGALFGGMWWYAMVAGSRLDRQRAAAAAPGKEPQ